MIFCEGIPHANLFAESFKKGTVGVVHSGQSEKKNNEILQSFRDKKIQFIISVDKFNEAIDIPDAEVIVFLRATNSKRIFFQQLGRGSRKTKFKKKVIVLDFVGNVERLVMVAELQKEIREEAKKLGHNLSKDVFNIKGEHYDLSFTETVFKDILKVIEAINCGFLSYGELKREVQTEGITSGVEYQKVQKNRLNWPRHPNVFYLEWLSWYKFLDTEKLSYKKLKKDVKKKGIKSCKKYFKLQKKYSSWPANPSITFASIWISWPNFFSKKRYSFKKIQKEVRKKKIKTTAQYLESWKENNWPSNPKYYFNKKWVNWRNFLGTEFLEYEKLREEVLAGGIFFQKEYMMAQKNKANWPSNPSTRYSEWTNWYDFLGKNK